MTNTNQRNGVAVVIECGSKYNNDNNVSSSCSSFPCSSPFFPGSRNIRLLTPLMFNVANLGQCFNRSMTLLPRIIVCWTTTKNKQIHRSALHYVSSSITIFCYLVQSYAAQLWTIANNFLKTFVVQA